ncbi:unnamed protein product, partial [Brachionus calyciflorus]
WGIFAILCNCNVAENLNVAENSNVTETSNVAENCEGDISLVNDDLCSMVDDSNGSNMISPKQPSKSTQKQNQIITNLGPEEIPKMLEFCLNFAKIFAKTKDLCELPLFFDDTSQTLQMLSKKYPTITLASEKNNYFDLMLSNLQESDTKIFRRLIVNFKPQLEIWAQNCKQLMLEKFGQKI